MTCTRRFSNTIIKRVMLLLGSLVTVVYVSCMYMTSYDNVASGIRQDNPKPITSEPVLLKRGKYYPNHKAHDYPLSVLPDPYLISNGEACKHLTELKYIITVISATSNFNNRNNIRRTWGNLSYYRQGEVKVVFILGRPALDLTQKAIEAESRDHQDIVQGKFIDTYINLTHKSVLSIRWVNDHCLNSKMVVKVDDDVVVNLFELFNMMTNGECCHNPMEIKCLRSGGNAKIFRSGSHSKYSVDDDYFPNLKTYPFSYCLGFFSLISSDVIPVLYETATHMPYFWIEDVYLTGILVSQSNQIHLKSMQGILYHWYQSKMCFSINKAKCVFIAGLSHNASDSQYIWSSVLKYHYEDLHRP